MATPESKRKLPERLSSLSVIKKAMRDSKRRAMQRGLSINTDIASYIIEDTLSFRGRAADDAVWWALALAIAGNTRERSRDEDDEQGVFDLDLPVPIRM